MKTLYISLFLIAIVLISCSESFLDVPIQGGATTSSDPDLAQKLVTGTYNSLLQGDSWGNGDVHGFAFVSVTDIASDDADKGSTLDDQKVPVGDIDDFNLTATNKFAETLWSGHYNAIGTANQALLALSTANIASQTKNRLIGEVRFLRGYLYFNLVRMYGDVPLVMRVPKNQTDANNDPAFQTRADKQIVYDSIVSDLQFAVDNLPLKSAYPVGHANKGAAESMLAKVYMYLQDWQKVYDLTQDVILSAKYGLVDYSILWRQAGDNCNESIFEIETGSYNNSNLGVSNYTVSQGVRVGGMGGWNDLGWGFCTPTTNLINAYEPGDKRKDATIIFIDNSGTHKGTILWDGFRIPSKDSVQSLYYNYKAYASATKEIFTSTDDKDRPKNIKILRYADVLLMNAEAAYHVGGDVSTPLHLIRQRAGLLDVAPTLDAIWKERRLELALEHDRFWDLVRQGRASQVLNAVGKHFVAGTHELLPIPNSQIQLSGGKLTQNYGY
ncbi:MAG: RagB/SusD family nutrient uptake outer membrane protein [Bacteroidales bacterium]|nr:RagB/SusD family nutrient uptake outer membrane protein [Bacteroidales bacterium]